MLFERMDLDAAIDEADVGGRLHTCGDSLRSIGLIR
jgi:hypothetical protein